MRAALASRNPGKAREIAQILAPAEIEVVAAPPEWVPPEETGSTYLENALLKARSLAAFTGEAAIADDSGIEVDALGGAPGVRSARYAGEDASDEDNLVKLIDVVAGTPEAKRTARYRCVAALVTPQGPEKIAEGEVEGTLIVERRGAGGFGYDPIFVALGEEQTMAELSPEAKDAISHRGKAFRALAAKIKPL